MSTIRTMVGLAGLTFFGVMTNEWRYRSNHPESPGLATVLIFLAVAGLLLCVAAMLATYAWERYEDDQRYVAMREQFRMRDMNALMADHDALNDE